MLQGEPLNHTLIFTDLANAFHISKFAIAKTISQINEIVITYSTYIPINKQTIEKTPIIFNDPFSIEIPYFQQQKPLYKKP